MTRGKEKAAAAWQGNDGTDSGNQPLSKETIIMKIVVPSIPSPPDEVLDWSGHTVATSSGFVVKPDTITMAGLCNADEYATGHIDRSRAFITAVK